eukprot:148167-Amphidinium_carterae.2
MRDDSHVSVLDMGGAGVHGLRLVGRQAFLRGALGHIVIVVTMRSSDAAFLAQTCQEHPFFLHYSIEDPGGLSAICNNCLMEISLLAGQESSLERALNRMTLVSWT